MKIKVYNDNGSVKITKMISEGVEISMFSNLQPGKVAEIEVEANISYSACVKDVSVSCESVKEML